LSAVVFNRDVELKGMRVDGLGNRVATLMVAEPKCNAPSCPKTSDAGLMQIKSGMAWWYRQYAWAQTQPQREDYEIAEFRAKSQRLGLWGDKNPVPPWDWLRALAEPRRGGLLK
jgi:endonuclease YncB( thermonuclease family)